MSRKTAAHIAMIPTPTTTVATVVATGVCVPTLQMPAQLATIIAINIERVARRSHGASRAPPRGRSELESATEIDARAPTAARLTPTATARTPAPVTAPSTIARATSQVPEST